jgi:hypothetical protein
MSRVLIRGALLVAQTLLAGSLLLLLFWFFAAGDGTVRLNGDEDLLGCQDDVLIDACQLQQLILLWLGPTVLFCSALAILVLRATLEAQPHHPSGPFNQWSDRLLPPRSVAAFQLRIKPFGYAAIPFHCYLKQPAPPQPVHMI